MSQTIFQSNPAQSAKQPPPRWPMEFRPRIWVRQFLWRPTNWPSAITGGRLPTSAGKPIGSVHGDSIGVHASDSANAWRHLALVANTRNCFASLILGVYQVALDRTARGGDFLHWDSLPLAQHLGQIKTTNPESLLREADEAIRGNLQAHAAALIHRYGELGHPSRAAFDLLARYAVSEDGALHGEKFYRTVSEEFASTREQFRWRHLVALARVTASEFGRPAPGVAEARSLLAV